MSSRAPNPPEIVLPEAGEPTRRDEAEVTFIGTATLLLRLGSFTLLTDPNFIHSGERAKIGFGMSVRRLTEPAMQIADLPPLDAVVLSHFHGDHFDDRAATELDKTLPVVTEPHAARKLRKLGFGRTVGLRTWQRQQFVRGEEALAVEALPGRHSPRLLGLVVPPVMGSLLEYSRDGRVLLRVYVTGDTLLDDRLGEIPQRHPTIDVCAIHLGGTRLGGVLLTMDAEQGVRALELVRPKVAVPVHFDDYAIFRSPLEHFLQAARSAGLATVVRSLGRGETWRLPLDEQAAA